MREGLDQIVADVLSALHSQSRMTKCRRFIFGAKPLGPPNVVGFSIVSRAERGSRLLKTVSYAKRRVTSTRDMTMPDPR